VVFAKIWPGSVREWIGEGMMGAVAGKIDSCSGDWGTTRDRLPLKAMKLNPDYLVKILHKTLHARQ
jgi:hypothetical protein